MDAKGDYENGSFQNQRMILNLSADRDERLVNQQRINLGRPQAGLLQKCQVRSGRSGRNSLRASNSLVAASAIADWVLLADFVVWMVRDSLFHRLSFPALELPLALCLPKLMLLIY